ncbi:MAG: hypothetical protein WDM89_03015 [Rhizomicrobium sp.]
MTLPIVKHSWLVRDTADVPAVVEEAFHVATMGRPGPVLIDLPKDIAAGTTVRTHAPSFDNRGGSEDDANALQHAEMMIAKARKPLLYIGGGVGIANAVAELRAFSRRTGHPVGRNSERSGRYPDKRSFVPGHAGDARHEGRQPRSPGMRSADRCWRAFRRPGDRQAFHLCAERPRDTFRHRSPPKSASCARPRSLSQPISSAPCPLYIRLA